MSTSKLPIKPNKTILNLLIRARLLMAHATLHASSNIGIDSMLAIHGMDNTVEYMIRIISDHLDYEGITGKSFPVSDLSGMVGELDKFLQNNFGAKLPYKNEIKMLRKIRNLVQHGMIDPNTDIDRFEEIVHRFFGKVTERIFGLSLEKLQISGIIEKEPEKELLNQAEAEINNKKYLEAVVACRDAFDNALFKQRKSSKVLLSAAPAISETALSNENTRRFFEVISDVLDELRYGLDAVKYERYLQIVEHIPNDYRVDNGGYTVMQKPWELSDAQFCYSFVSDTILKWQSQKLEPLYEVEISEKEYSIQEYIDDLLIESESGYGCHYYEKEYSEAKLLYVGRETKDFTNGFRKDETHAFKSKHYEQGELKIEIEHKGIISDVAVKLVTHNPERWEVVISYRNEPFSFDRRDYSKGKIVERSPSINSATQEELMTLYSIDNVAANKVIAYREAVGKIESTEDLERINGLSIIQKRWLIEFTTI